jgi:hypothetical protein
MQPYVSNLDHLVDQADPDASMTLDADRREVSTKHLTEMVSTLTHLSSLVSEPGFALNTSLATKILKLSEYRLADLAAALGLQTDTRAAVEERARHVREANQRIYELEALIASRSVASVQMGLKGLEDRLTHWWRTKGLGYVVKMGFCGHGCEATLSAHLSGDFCSILSETPATDARRAREWHAKLRERGFVLYQAHPSSRDLEVVDCDASRTALSTMIEEGLPCTEIRGLRSFRPRGAPLLLREIDIVISDLDGLAALEGPPIRLG